VLIYLTHCGFTRNESACDCNKVGLITKDVCSIKMEAKSANLLHANSYFINHGESDYAAPAFNVEGRAVGR
jgi:hypothetical protein